MATKLPAKTKGFTIVELLIVVVVIAILAAIVTVAYNGIANRASDSTAKADMETTAKKIAVDKVSNDVYPLTLADVSGGGIATSGDIRTEYTSDGTTYCATTSSVRAKTDYYENDSMANWAAGTCPNHLGYQGGPGTFSTSSIFGASAPPGTYQVYNDGGGNLWVGNRFYTTRTNGVRIVGARVWEPPTASAAFLSTPISVQVFTQDYQGGDLGGWGSLGSAAITTTYNGTRKAGSWTYIPFTTSTNIAPSTTGAGPKDNVTIAVKYDGNYYVAPSPAMGPDFTQSSQLSNMYLMESATTGRAVSNVYTGSAAYYYGIDILVTAL